MIKKPAARTLAAIVLLAGLVIASQLDTDEPLESPHVAATPLQSPIFEINWHRGGLALSGHTLSAKHEQNLLQVATSSYRGAPIATDFRPLGVVPEHWSDMTVQVLYLLARTESSHARLAVDAVAVRGVTGDELGWNSRLEALKLALPISVSLTTDTLVVEHDVRAADMCAHAFATFDAGPINFLESGTEFRSSAYPRMDRVIALARACEHSSIAVTGHTDASGSESWNQRLSLQRANAVGDYLARGGIDRPRLVIAGMGASMPIADNKTRYGRSHNRRIEITLTKQLD